MDFQLDGIKPDHVTDKIFTFPFLKTPTQEYVVPRSIPIADMMSKKSDNTLNKTCRA